MALGLIGAVSNGSFLNNPSPNVVPDVAAFDACSIAAGAVGQCSPKYPEEGHVLAPWVQVVFQGSGTVITVGNSSTDPVLANHAVIKDFEFGHSDGLQCRITIQDESGSSFVKFMENMLQDLKCAVPATGYQMFVDFGWIRTGCIQPLPIVKNPSTYNMICDNVTSNYSGGKFTYEITGTDIGIRMFDSRLSKVYGSEEDKITLVDAITQMFQDTDFPPAVSSVKFLKHSSPIFRFQGNNIVRVPPDTAPIEFNDDDGDPEKGPKGVWDPKGMDKISAAMDWLRPNVTSDSKGIIPTYNSEVAGGEIIFWEDYKPNCGEAKDWDFACLGTYIVNGGQKSSVLDFTTNIRAYFGTLQGSGGGMSDFKPMLNDDGKLTGMPGCPTLSRASIKSAGVTNTVPPDANVEDKHNEQAAEILAKGQAQQLKAFKLFHDNIEATLTIIGDPTLMRPSLGIWSKNVKIIFINPYHLFSTDGLCGDWLAAPSCNEILSNKAWLVKSVTHRISGGSFTTSLGLYLTTPGVDLDIGEPFGGPGAGGWTPPANC